MAFAKLADMSSEIEVVVFPGVYESSIAQWQRDNVLIIIGKIGSGRASGASGELKVLADQIHHIDSFTGSSTPTPPLVENVPYVPAKPVVPKLYIRLEDSSNQSLLLELKSKLDSFAGETEVVLVTGEDSAKQVIKLPQQIDVNETSLRDLAGVFGATNVVVK
jgi:DNA polymerase III alpha subunit